MLLDLEKPTTQGIFGGLVGLAQPVVAGLVATGVLRAGAPCSEWLTAYTRHLRDVAHGRGGAVGEARQRLLHAQALRTELENKRTAGELCSARDVELACARIGHALAQELDSLPARLAPRLVGLSLPELGRELEAEQRALRLRVLAIASTDETPAVHASRPLAPPACVDDVSDPALGTA